MNTPPILYEKLRMNTLFRSTRPEVFCEKGVLRNFTKIHRKTLVPEPLFYKSRRPLYCIETSPANNRLVSI